jgi:hypothetical protein
VDLSDPFCVVVRLLVLPPKKLEFHCFYSSLLRSYPCSVSFCPETVQYYSYRVARSKSMPVCNSCSDRPLTGHLNLKFSIDLWASLFECFFVAIVSPFHKSSFYSILQLIVSSDQFNCFVRKCLLSTAILTTISCHKCTASSIGLASDSLHVIKTGGDTVLVTSYISSPKNSLASLITQSSAWLAASHVLD